MNEIISTSYNKIVCIANLMDNINGTLLCHNHSIIFEPSHYANVFWLQGFVADESEPLIWDNHKSEYDDSFVWHKSSFKKQKTSAIECFMHRNPDS